MTDVDDSVRDWATFGIGSLCDIDTPELRDALAARLADADEEVRGEAVVGLATRGDNRAIRAIVQAFASDDPSHLVFILSSTPRTSSSSGATMMERSAAHSNDGATDTPDVPAGTARVPEGEPQKSCDLIARQAASGRATRATSVEAGRRPEFWRAFLRPVRDSGGRPCAESVRAQESRRVHQARCRRGLPSRPLVRTDRRTPAVP